MSHEVAQDTLPPEATAVSGLPLEGRRLASQGPFKAGCNLKGCQAM